MKYTCYDSMVPQESRKEFNEKILYLIDNDRLAEFQISDDDIYNAYTGIGGLHGLNRSDYDNYAEYSDAKKEIENGQFFTPFFLCKLVAECLAPSNDAIIADLTCGAGGFFNFMPTESNLYGCEIDTDAYKVAHHLYPAANLENKDIRTYAPSTRFDYVVGNPPFNLKWWIEGGKEISSQLFYCQKAAELLKPNGIMAIIVPQSFLADDFSNKTAIKEMNQRFHFLGQVALPYSAFMRMGVPYYETKLQFWQKRMDGDIGKPYRIKIDYRLSTDYDHKEAVEWITANLLAGAKHSLEANRYNTLKELAKDRELSENFMYQVEKMLYQIKCHPRLKEHYSKCCEYVHRFFTQKQPEDMPYETWCKTRLTEPKVISYLQRTLSKQNAKPPEDRIALVKRDYDFVYKGYSAKARKQMSEEMKNPVPIYEIASTDGLGEFPGYEKLIRKKQREYAMQNMPFSCMQEDPDIAKWLTDFHLWDNENEEEIRLNDIQRHDLNLILQKRYGLLQWEQGSGKTLAGISTAIYRMEKQNIHHTWVISPAISIRNNWDVVLPNYNISYVFAEKLSDLQKIKRGDFVIATLNFVSKYQRQLKRWIRMHNQKINLVFDESDEMSNPSSVRTKAVLNIFRRCKTKLLTTGTSTRNNISEFVPQLELLYNNSVNMLSWSDTLYHYERGEDNLSHDGNPYFGKPIPAYKEGYRLFTASHLPEKITVFGVGQRTQDIYNSDVLSEILDKTVITRTFSEVVGKEIRRIHQVPLVFSAAEREVYQLAMEKFYEMRSNYFASTGNSRKDSMMRLIQQITLMLRISAAPDTVVEYTGDAPVKIMKIIDMVDEFSNEIVAIGVRHKVVLDAYKQLLEEAFPDRKIFVVTGSTTTFAQRRKLRTTLKESGNGILLCTQQSLPSSVNFEFVNKVIIPELHYNNARMSQFYMRFVRYNSTDWKDIYFVTYGGSIESNLMQMVLAKEKINLFMKGQDADLDAIYDKFGVDYDLLSLLMYREEDEKGNFHIRWGKQKIA